MRDNNSSETKIIKTFKAEVVFLITLIGFISGILGVYYKLSTRTAVIETKLDGIASLLRDHTVAYEEHQRANGADHDLLMAIKATLNLK